MKRLLTVAIAFCLLASNMGLAQTKGGSRNYIVGFYNLENLFDTYDDPAKNDEEFLPEGKNKWTPAKYEKKVHNMARVIAAMAQENGRYHTILGISEIENRMVVEDLVSDPQIAAANYQIIHYDGPDRRGVDVALLYNPKQFELLESVSIPYTFEGSEIEFSLNKEEQDYFRTRDILMVRGKIDGEMFAFFVTHTPSRLGGKGNDLRSRCGEIIYNYSLELEAKYPGIKIAAMGDMNDNPFDESMAVWLHGKEKMEVMTEKDWFNPFWSMLKAGYGSLCYQYEWNIYDQVLVNYNLTFAPEGGLKIHPIIKDTYYGRIFKKPFMINQKGQYKDQPFRTFSNGAFVGGYSDHFPSYILISK